MVHSFILPQETIASIKNHVEILERCLNDANLQDEAMAEILELANSRQISLNQLREEVIQMQYKLNKFINLVKVFEEKVEPDQLSVLLFVRYNFMLKEIFDRYWDFIFLQRGKKLFLKLILDSENIYKTVKNEVDYGRYSPDDKYIIEETIKHLIQALINAGLRINLLTEEKLKDWKMEDITPQETEVMLTSLASTKKWDQVYRNLA